MHNILRDWYYSNFPNSSKYLTYGRGKTNVVISAPHGGGIKPKHIPDRKYGNKGQDTYTRRIIQRVLELSNEKPYFVYADIHRSKLDLNRGIEEAAQGNKEMEAVWKEWNTILPSYLEEAVSNYGKCLYIDLHSQNNNSYFQIGYGLKVKDYLDIKNHRVVTSRSTMYALKGSRKSEFHPLFGNYSFPWSIESRGFKVLVPKEEDKYLNGGRNILHYSGDGVGAIQIECPISVIKYNVEDTSIMIVKAIKNFKERYM